jgi:hypothetical protein
MRVAGVVLAVFALTPGVASADDVRLVREEVSLRSAARTTAAMRAPTRFNLVGLHWQGLGTLRFRTRDAAGRWSTWHEAEHEGPRTSGWQLGNAFWTGPSDAIQYRHTGRVSRVRAHFVWSAPHALPVRTTSLAGAPQIVPRLSWGANERIRRGHVAYAPAVRFAVVHHTAGPNGYSRAESAAIVRGIQLYHVRGNGWNDIGYNFLVDRYGQVFEGRFGGMTRPVIGAHAQGFNTGSVGVSVLGTFGSSAPPAAAVSALTRLLAWRLDVAHVDPLSRVTWASLGNPRFPNGSPVALRAVSGHRDTYFTDCPGGALYARLPRLARSVFGTGLPKLFAPTLQGSVGGLVRFRARLTAPLPWTVTVRDRAGASVASGTGAGRLISWAWDSSSVARDRYSWTMEARGVRQARGTIGSRPTTPPVLLDGVSVSPRTVTPNDDGQGDFAVVRYTLGAPAAVTATFTDSSGATLATLFSEARPAGRQSFRFTAATIPDGRYRIVLAVETVDGRQATASVDVLVSRLLRAFAAAPAVFSPNGDGTLDEVRFSFELAGPAAVRLQLRRAGRLAAGLFDEQLPAGAQQLTWDGSSPRVGDGRYVAALTVSDPVATVSLTTPVTVDTRRPRLTLISRRPLRVRVSERATLVGTLEGRPFERQVARGVVSLPAARAGRLVARDEAGNRSRVLRIS